METASVSHDEEHQHAVISFADGAKVQQNFETAMFKAKYFYDFLNIPAASPFSVNQIIQTTDAEVSHLAWTILKGLAALLSVTTGSAGNRQARP